MTDLNKEREAFEALPLIKEKLNAVYFDETLNSYFAAMINSSPTVKYVQGAWMAWQEKAKAQAVPETHIVVPRTREVVVAIEKMVEQQVEASGITSDVFRLDGWRILDAIQEASKSGAEG